MSVAKWVRWPGVEAITVRELSNLIAEALHPNAKTIAEHTAVGVAYLEHDTEFPAAIRAGAFRVRDPSTMGVHSFPLGASLWKAVVLPKDVRAFLEEKGIGIRRTAVETNTADWWDLDMDAAYWWNEESVSGLQAALLLAGSNPNKGEAEALSDAETTTHEHGMAPAHFRKLKNTFVRLDTGPPRSLKEWLELAKQKKLRHHHWINEWIDGAVGGVEPNGALANDVGEVQVITAVEEESKVDKPKAQVARPKQRVQESRILEILIEQGFDPKNLPARETGKKGPKAAVRPVALSEPVLFTSKTFDTAWERLRQTDEISGA